MQHQKMTSLLQRFLLACLIICTPVLSRGPVYKPPPVDRLTERFHPAPVTQKMSTLYGGSNIQMKSNGSYADITLDKTSGSGLVSKDVYHHGFFSAAIKLPMGVTSGVVLAFYMSNSDVFLHNHDKVDFELLGHEKRREWVLQTNIYGNGSVKTGREEKFYLWFDPTQEFHEYSMHYNNRVFPLLGFPRRHVSPGKSR